MSENKSPRPNGRPQSYDRTVALTQAMRLFWERGYNCTTSLDLIEAMGMSASSIYKAFGNKEQLYREAIETFLTGPGKYFDSILSTEPDTRTAFARLSEAAAGEFTREDMPAGCMVSLEGTHLPPDQSSIRDLMRSYRALTEHVLQERLLRGQALGDLSQDVDTALLAAYFAALFRGMVVQARDGATRERLIDIARTAMRAWPEPAEKPAPSEKGVAQAALPQPVEAWSL